jgi:VWFA-related protein
MRGPSSRIFLTLFLPLLLIQFSLLGQDSSRLCAFQPLLSKFNLQKQQPQAKQFVRDQTEYQVRVVVKLIQVYVTDKNGQPAPDLKADDFEVFDNDRPVSIIHFERHSINDKISDRIAPQPQAQPPASQPALNRKFFFFFDFAFSEAKGILKAKEAALQFMDKVIRPGDQISLLTYSALGGLTLQEYLTSDHFRIRHLLQDFGLKNATGRAASLSNFYLTEPSDLSAEISGNQTRQSLDIFPEDTLSTVQGRRALKQEHIMRSLTDRQEYVEQAHLFLLALTNLAQVLRTVSGYKNIILFSGGIARQLLFGRSVGSIVGDLQSVDTFTAQIRDYDSSRPDLGLRNEFERLLNELKASSCIIYAVDISGTSGQVDLTGPSGQPPGTNDSSGSESLRELASETGGNFFASTVSPDKMVEEVVKSTGFYYVLGYQVDEHWDGKFHKIKVRVKKKGYEVYAQAGYFDPKPFNKYSKFEKLIHLIELALNDEPAVPFLPIEIPAASINFINGNQPAAMIYARASRQALTDVLGSKTEANLLLFNKNGDLESIKRFRIARKEKERKDYNLYLPSFLVTDRPGLYNCILIIRNMETGRSARARLTVEIAVGKPAIPFLDSPVLLISDNLAKEIFAPGDPALSSLYGYSRDSFSAIAGQIPAGTERIFAALRLIAPAGSEDGLAVKVQLRNESGDEIKNLQSLILHKIREEDLVKLLLEIRTEALPPGHYKLNFIISGAKLGKELQTDASFEIK